MSISPVAFPITLAVFAFACVFYMAILVVWIGHGEISVEIILKCGALSILLQHLVIYLYELLAKSAF